MKAMLVLTISLILLIAPAWADNSGFMARLVDDNGQPLITPLNLDVILRVNGTIRCRENLISGTAEDGHLSIPMDFPNVGGAYRCDSTSTLMEDILKEAIANGEQVTLELVDNTNSRTYNPQVVSQVPLTMFTRDLGGNGAADGAYLQWNGSQWVPGPDFNVAGCTTGEKIMYEDSTSEFICGTVTNTNISEGAIETADLVNGSVTAAKVANLTVIDDNIADNNITAAKLDGSLVLSAAKFSTVSFAGADFADGSITANKIANITIEGGKIQAGALTTAKIVIMPTVKIAFDTVVGNDFQNSSITEPKIVDETITSSKIANNTITAAKVTDDSLDTIKIADSGIDTADLADNNLQTIDLVDSSVDDAEVTNNTIQTAKILNANVTSVKFNDLTVDTADFANQTIEHTKFSGIAANCADNQYLRTDGSGNYTCVNMQDEFHLKTNMIMMWYKNAASIPTGWQVCNGTNGTPDLRGRFMKATNVLADTGVVTGGSINHVHRATWTDNHTHTINASSNHNHEIVTDPIPHTHGAAAGSHDHSNLTTIGTQYTGNAASAFYPPTSGNSLSIEGATATHRHSVGLNIDINTAVNQAANSANVPAITDNTNDATVTFSGTTTATTLTIDQDTAASSILPPFTRLYFICKL